MADQDWRAPINDSDKAAPRRERSFAPLSSEEIKAAAQAAAKEQEKKRRRPPPGEIPAARVDPDMVRELEDEIADKVSSGRRRMRWFANHLILFVAAVAGAVPLKLYMFPNLHEAFLYVPFALWVGLLAIHANYAMAPILRRSKAEAQLKALMPAKADADKDEKDEKDARQQEFDWERK